MSISIVMKFYNLVIYNTVCVLRVIDGLTPTSLYLKSDKKNSPIFARQWDFHEKIENSI